MEPMVEAGVCTFKVFLAYKGVLMVTDDQFFARCSSARATSAALDHGPRRERRRDRPARQARARRAGTPTPIYHALTRPEVVEAEATGRAVRLAEYAGAVAVHRARDLRGRRGRDRGRPGSAACTCAARPASQYLDQHDRRPAPRPGLRGRPLRLLAAAARRRQPGAAVGRVRPRRARERLDRPLPVQLRAEGARAATTSSKIPNGLPVIQHRLAKLWDHGRGRAAGSRRAELVDLHLARRSRAASASTTRARSRPARTPTSCVFDPSTPLEFSTRHLVHERRLRPLRGRDGRRGSVRHTLLPRRRWSTTAARSARSPGHGRFVRARWARAAAVAS